jgi:hypothetical protein
MLGLLREKLQQDSMGKPAGASSSYAKTIADSAPETQPQPTCGEAVRSLFPERKRNRRNWRAVDMSA